MLVLIVEPTSEARAAFERTLREAGLDTIAASSPRKATPMMIDTAVDAVVCRMSGKESDPLICWVASHKPSVHVIVTGAAGEPFREKFRDAVNLELLEGASTEDVVATLQTMGARKGFFGSAIEIELFDYVQMIALTGRDKVVQLATPNGTATMWFEHGDIVHVEYGDFRGEMAFYKVLAEARGSFSEVYWHNPPRRTVTRSSTHLLMEAARQSDEGTLGRDAIPEVGAEDPETSFADLSVESTRIAVGEGAAANDARGAKRSKKRPTGEVRAAGGKKRPTGEVRRHPSSELPAQRKHPTGEVPVSGKRPAGPPPAPRKRPSTEISIAKPGAPPVIGKPRAAPPLRPMASDNEDEDFAALVEDSLSEQMQEIDQGAIEASDQFKLRGAVPDAMPEQDSSLEAAEPQAAMSTVAGHAILDDPDTRAVMLEQFWQFEGINGVAIISSTGKVLAEEMRNNSSLVTLAGFYMRGAARIARSLGHNVFDGVVARSASGQKMVMVGMGAASAVLSVEADADPEQVRDAVMGVE